MQDKICLITGATSGIGYETALELARMGATIIVCGRDQEKTANTVIKIRSATDNPKVDFLLADLSNFEEVRKLAEEFKSQYKKLDVLVNNVGAIFKEFDLNPEDIEMTMALNHFSVFLLSGLLYDSLKKSHSARIINVSSMMHKMAKNNFTNLNDETNYKALNAYAKSKLALIHFSYELSRKLNGSKIKVNAMHPGWVKSNFGSGFYTGFYGFIDSVFKPVQITAEKGAKTIIYLASDQGVEKLSGKYFIKKKPVASSADSYNTNVAKQLWELSEELTHFNWKIDVADHSMKTKVEPETKKKDDKGPKSDKPSGA